MKQVKCLKICFNTIMLKKWNFLFRISSVNVTKSAISCGFGHIHWRNPQWNTSFFVQYELLIPIILEIVSPYMLWQYYLKNKKTPFAALVFTNIFLLCSWNLKNNDLLRNHQTFLGRALEISLAWSLLIFMAKKKIQTWLLI